MKNVSAIFLDMDGTLLHENNRASVKTADVITKLRDAGFRVFLATGRAYEEIYMLIPKGLEFDGIISSNGTLGHIQKNVLFEHDLSEAAVKSIVHKAKSAGIYYEIFPFNEPRFALTEDQDWMLNMVQGEKPHQVAESEWLSRHEAIKDKLTWRHEIPEGLAYSKIYLFHPRLQTIKAFKDVMQEQHEALKIEVSNSTHNNVETMKLGINKGTGIKEMCEYYNIDIGQTLVMGDSDNDRTMFEVGAYTVAMKNAKPHIKALTQYETEFDNNEDGAALFLEKHFL
ncbi:HAD family hydrolase [Staphylococcus hyicus]|uniref:HAD family hydrolase n=1 Tax=Staphylococcus hyicus TaxID=1284 RepID=UPI0036D342D5